MKHWKIIIKISQPMFKSRYFYRNILELQKFVRTPSFDIGNKLSNLAIFCLHCLQTMYFSSCSKWIQHLFIHLIHKNRPICDRFIKMMIHFTSNVWQTKRIRSSTLFVRNALRRHSELKIAFWQNQNDIATKSIGTVSNQFEWKWWRFFIEMAWIQRKI